MGAFTYLKGVITDRQVASIAPSSTYAIRRICDPLDLENAKVVVEYGPGEGCFTRYLLPRLSEEARLYAFETNPSFVNSLRRKSNDRRLRVIHQSAERANEVVGRDDADVVISGIPFSLIPATVGERIIERTAEIVSAEGVFILYQTFPPTAARDLFLRPLLEKYFVIEQVEYEFRNLPPLRIYRCRLRNGRPMSRSHLRVAPGSA